MAIVPLKMENLAKALLLVIAVQATFAVQQHSEPIAKSSTTSTIFTIPPLEDIMMASPTLEVQIILALFHTILWFILVNFVIYNIARNIIPKLESKKQFLHLHREANKQIINFDAGEEGEKQTMEFAWVYTPYTLVNR